MPESSSIGTGPCEAAGMACGLLKGNPSSLLLIAFLGGTFQDCCNEVCGSFCLSSGNLRFPFCRPAQNGAMHV